MREHPPHEQCQQQNRKDAKLKFRRADRRLGQAGEMQEQHADQSDAAGQAKPLEARQAVCAHHAVKLQEANDVEQHDESPDERHRESASGEQTVKNNPQQHYGAGQAPCKDGCFGLCFWDLGGGWHALGGRVSVRLSGVKPFRNGGRERQTPRARRGNPPHQSPAKAAR